MSNNEFKPEKYVDHCIVDRHNKVVGHVRVKPSGILWAPKEAKAWYGVSIADFATWVEANGKRQNK